MASPIGSAFVEVLPDFTGFREKLLTQLREQLIGVHAAIPATIARVQGAAEAGIAGAVSAQVPGQLSLLGENVGAVAAAAGVSTAALDSLVVAETAAGVAATGATAPTARLAAAEKVAGTQAEIAAAKTGIFSSAMRALGIQGDATAAQQTRLGSDTRSLQAALQGAGQGALSSRIAFFGLRGALLAVAVGGFAESLIQAGKLEQSLHTLGLVTQATSADLERASLTARQLGADVSLPAVTAASAADAMTLLARSGLSVKDSIDGARGVLTLAAAAQTDMATASLTVARNLNAFNLAGDQATKVADLLAGASITGGTSIQEMADALSSSAAAAHQLGIPLNDLTVALAEVAKRGLQGEQGGTALRNALIRLVAPTTAARHELEALGINISDAQGNFVGLPSLFEQFRVALQGLSPELQTSALATIFGTRAFRAIALAAQGGSAAFEEARVGVERQGIASDLAAARMSGFIGQIKALGSTLQSVGGEIGSVFLPPLETLLQMLNNLATALDKAIIKFKDFASQAGSDLEAINEKAKDTTPGLSGLEKVLGDVGRFEPKAFILGDTEDEKKINALTAAIKRLDAERKVLAEGGAPTAGIDAQISSLKAAQAAAEAAQKHAAALAQAPKGPDPAEVIRRLRAELVREAEQGLPTAGLQKQIDALLKPFDFNSFLAGPKTASTARSSAVLTATIEAQVEQMRAILKRGGIAGGNDFVQNLQKQLGDLDVDPETVLAALRTLNIGFIASGKDLGKNFGLAVGKGVTEAETQAVTDARNTLQKVIQAGNEAIQNAVVSAKQNLAALGDTLASQIAQMVDAGPLGQQINRLQAKLNSITTKQQVESLQQGLAGARKDLAEASQSIITIGKPTAAQQAAIDAFLAPFKQRVKDAQTSIQAFDLTQTITKVQGHADKIKDAAKKGIDDLIAEFNAGQITMADLNAGIARILQTKGIPNYKTAGKALGTAFTQSFIAELKGISDQAAQILLAPSKPGVPANIVSVEKEQARNLADIQKARDDLQTAIDKKAGDSLKVQQNIERIMLLFEKALKAPKPTTQPKPKPSPTKPTTNLPHTGDPTVPIGAGGLD